MTWKRHVGRWLWLAAAIAAVTGLVWGLWPRPVEVDVARVERGPLAATVRSIDGRTQVKQLYVVATPVAGTLDRITLRAGEAVAAGAPVARIWPGASTPLDPRSRAEALAVASSAQAAVAQAEATEQEASAALLHARSVLAEDQPLAASGAIPAAEAKHQVHETEIRQRAVDAAHAATREARAQLGRAQALLGPGKPGSAGPVTTVNSPVTGRILHVVRDSGGPVAAGAPLVEIGDVGELEVVADLLSSDAAQVRAGAPARVTGWGGPPLAARVRAIEPAAFTKVSALGLEEQRVHVVLDLDAPPPPALGHDYRVDVAIVVWQGRDVVRVPATALFRDGDRWAVFAVSGGRAHVTPVEIGASDGTWTAVTGGLAAGATVIAQPGDTIADGTRVAPRTWAAPKAVPAIQASARRDP